MNDVDEYGVPLHLVGDKPAPEFFGIVGRIVVVNGKIEYLKDRLAHLPTAETTGVRKVEQFHKRVASSRLERNAIVHSLWAFGTDTNSPDLITGIRYKIRPAATGTVATLSIRDVEGSAADQDVVQYRLDDLHEILQHDVATLRIGEIAFQEVQLAWARRQLDETITEE